MYAKTCTLALAFLGTACMASEAYERGYKELDLLVRLTNTIVEREQTYGSTASRMTNQMNRIVDEEFNIMGSAGFALSRLEEPRNEDDSVFFASIADNFNSVLTNVDFAYLPTMLHLEQVSKNSCIQENLIDSYETISQAAKLLEATSQAPQSEV